LAPRQAALAVEHTQVVMAANDERSRRLLELEYTAEGMLFGVHWQHVNLAGLTGAELDGLHVAGSLLRKGRVSRVQLQRKIGRNEPCPCGSGRKYKRCCCP